MADLTAQELCDAALRLVGAIDPGQTPGTTERTNALEALKIMLRSWSAEGLMVFVNSEDSHALTAGTKSYTIGSGATINTSRPVRINDAYVNYGGFDYPVRIIGQSEYINISDKADASEWPIYLWYLPGYSVGTIYLWPPGGGTLYMYSHKALTEPGLADDVTFPGEYDAAIKFNLAVDIAPEYGGLRDPSIAARAERYKNTIISINAALSVNIVPVHVIGVRRRYNIDVE